MPGPTENRSVAELAKKKKNEPIRRKLTKKEHHARRRQYIVTWALVFVFAVTSVGFLMSFRPSPVQDQENPEAQSQQAQLRLEELQRKARENPSEEHWHYELAHEYLEQMRDLGKAQEELKATLAINPSHVAALHELAEINLMQNKPADAEAVLKKGMAAERTDLERQNKDLKPGDIPIQPDVRLRGQLFHAYYLMGPEHVDDARKAIREGLQLNPGEAAEYLGQMVQIMLQTGKKDDALKALQIAIDEAQALKDTETVKQLTGFKKAIAAIQLTPPQPGRPASPPASPAASPAAGGPKPTPASPAPAAPAPASAPSAPAPAAGSPSPR